MVAYPARGRSGPRYLRFVESLTEAIATGQLPEGTRLPTHRDLADQLARHRRHGEPGLRRGRAPWPGLGRGRTRNLRAAAGLSLRSAPRAVARPRRPELEPSPDSRGPGPEGRRGRRPARSREARRAPRPARLSGRRREPPRPRGGRPWIARTGLVVDPDDVLVCSGSQHGITTVLATLLLPATCS